MRQPRDPQSGRRTVVSPTYAAISRSSNPTTETSPGTASPDLVTASITPSAWVSDAAKIAVGGSGRASSSPVNRCAVARV